MAYLQAMTQITTAGAMVELPPSDTKPWVVQDKTAVVRAVHIGRISLLEACLRYNLPIEEFLAWERAVERPGTPGLRIYRDTADPQSGGAIRDSLDSPASLSRDAPGASPAPRFVSRVFGTVSALSIRTIQKSCAVTNWQYSRRVKSPLAVRTHLRALEGEGDA
jgi:hypothetical protein